MKAWYITLLLIFGMTFITFGMAGDSSSSASYKKSGKDQSSDDTNSAQRSYENCCEPTDIEANVAEDPNECPENEGPLCDPMYPYRTINGSCNNLDNPNWGVQTECYLRFQPTFYEGYENARKSTEGGDLPEPRVLTLNLFKSRHRPTKKVSFMFSLFGQTVAHDLSLSFNVKPHGSCCEPGNNDQPACYTISVPSNDPFYSKHNVTCLKMNRIQTCSLCKTTQRQQKNGATASLDVSILYGTTDAKSDLVRAKDGTGKLRSNKTKVGEILPSGLDQFDTFCLANCFFAGDARVDQHLPLTCLHTLYMREHNRLATELKKLNPHWEEERLFHEARRIKIAQFQSITFKEYLPYLLGPSLMEKFDFALKRGSEGTQYNPEIRLGVWSEFAFAGFRLHNMIPTQIGALNLEFRDMYFNANLIRQGHMDHILEGACKVPSAKMDQCLVPDVTNYLLQEPGEPHGSDLGATDLQRGREVGLAPYVYLVRYCFGDNVKISSFEDLSPGLMSNENANMLKRNYKSVEDVDLWAGINMENTIPDAVVGPTAACMIAKQMYVVKFGDRFFFEHGGEISSFTPDQRATLKQSSFSRMLCDNTAIEEIQQNTMLLKSRRNPIVSCDDIPRINLTLWQEDWSR